VPAESRPSQAIRPALSLPSGLHLYTLETAASVRVQKVAVIM